MWICFKAAIPEPPHLKIGDDTIERVKSFKLLEQRITSLVSNAKKNYYQLKAEGTRETNPAKWYKTIFELAAANDCNSQPPADAAELAERLQQSFTKPWQNANPTEIPDVGEIENLLKNDTSPPLPSIGQIKATLKHPNPRKATGSDEIPPWLLKRYHEELAPVIHNIICSSISQAKYPTLYKQALVTPVPKIYPSNDMDNDFRQISVLPQLAKVLESIQLKLNKVDLKIKDNQHAFTHGRSTVSALASITQNCNMQEVLDGINDWAHRNKMKLNAKKTKDMWICFKAAIPEQPHLKIGDDTIERVKSFKLLGLWIDNTLKWNTHIDEIARRENKRLFYLRECRRADLPTNGTMGTEV
ncbi:Hypothetical predicted protein, partial [Paramuricea clavata]